MLQKTEMKAKSLEITVEQKVKENEVSLALPHTTQSCNFFLFFYILNEHKL